MELISAQQICPSLPGDLKALILHSRPKGTESVTIAAVGDTGFSGRIKGQPDHLISSRISRFLKSADLRFCNLETPLVSEAHSDRMFCAPVTTGIAELQQASFNVVNIANNHIRDAGAEGLRSTIQALEGCSIVSLGSGVPPFGDSAVVTTVRKAINVGWLACARTKEPQHEPPFFWEYDSEALLEAVTRCRKKVDVLIVSIHIGYMLVEYPSPEQRLVADRLRDAGVDLILMHHAHVLQGCHLNNDNRLACFNLGNFLLDWEEGNVRMNKAVTEQRSGGVFFFEFDKQGLSLAALLPTYICDDLRVDWACASLGESILSHFSELSAALSNDCTSSFLKQRAERNTGLAAQVMLFHILRGNWRTAGTLVSAARPRHAAQLARWLFSKATRISR